MWTSPGEGDSITAPPTLGQLADGNSSFIVSAGEAASPPILDIALATACIPAQVGAHIVLSDEQFASDQGHMSDSHTKRIAMRATNAVSVSPWQFVDQLSRLVLDPERFPDHRRSCSVGAVCGLYGNRSRKVAACYYVRERGVLLNTYLHPYAHAFADLLDARLGGARHPSIPSVENIGMNEPFAGTYVPLRH